MEIFIPVGLVICAAIVWYGVIALVMLVSDAIKIIRRR